MGLTLVWGRSGSGKSQYCLTEIAKQIEDNPNGSPLILLLPEHATFMAERHLAEMTGGYIRAYIFGFKRLAHQVLRSQGGALRPSVSELGKKILLMRFLHQRQNELLKLGKASRQPNFSEVMLALVQEFKSYEVTPQDIAKVAGELAGTELGAKLTDIGELYQDYQSAIEEAYTDPDDTLTLLANKIGEAELFRGASVWIDGFRWFNPREISVLKAMLSAGVPVTVTLTLADVDSPARQEESDLFRRQFETRQTLMALAKECQTEYREKELANSYRNRENEVGAYIERDFFLRGATAFNGNAAGLRVIEASTHRREVTYVANEIRRLCREEGCRYRDIAVLTRGEGYYDIISDVFDTYEIAYFAEQKRKAIHHPLAELIRASLEAVRTWSYETIFRVLKTEFFPLTRDEIDRLENYVLAFGIRGSYWTQAEPWTMRKRLLLEEDELSEEAEEELSRINDSRMRAVLPLKGLADSLKKAKTITQYMTAIYLYLEELDVPAKLTAWADEETKAGNLTAAAEQMQIWKQVIVLLEQIAEVGKDEPVRVRDMTALIDSALEAMEFSLVPQGLDHVAIGSMEQNNAENLPIVFLLGVEDGVLPRRGGKEGLLNDGERQTLYEMGTILAPGTAADALEEEFLSYQLLTKAKRRTYISYALSDEEGKGLRPSPLVVRLCRMTKAQRIVYVPPSVEEDDVCRLSHPRQAFGNLANVLCSRKDGEQLGKLWQRVYEWGRQSGDYRPMLKQALSGLFHHNEADTLPRDMASQLYLKDTRLYGSVTRFERFRQCPFSHFARYGLKLKEREIFRLKPPDLGQFFHAALKVFGQRTQSAEGWGKWTQEECASLAHSITTELAPRLANEILLSNAQRRALLARLERTITKAAQRLCQFGQNSQFRPYAYEKSFGGGQDSLPALRWKLSDGTELAITGQIDRIDMMKKDGKQYFLVIDYKSGKVYLTMPEVYYGLRLQLLTYLMAIEEAKMGGKDIVPAGVLYYFLRQPFIDAKQKITEEEAWKEICKKRRMPGWLLKDQEIIKNLDATLADTSEFLCVSLKKDGEFKSNCLQYLKTEEEFARLCAYTSRMLTQTGEEILAGDIALRPVTLGDMDACQYCTYKSVCQFDELLEENHKLALERISDEEAMDRMKGEGGEA